MEQRLECDCCCVGHLNWHMGVWQEVLNLGQGQSVVF